jgi:primosomal protein N' (replication factor Y)
MSNVSPLPRCVKVLVNLPGAPPLDYLAPDDWQPRPGDWVTVPLGRRREVGIVAEADAASTLAPGKLKPILARVDGLTPLGEDWLALTRFAAEYYQSGWGEAALPALPSFFRTPPGPRHAASLRRLKTAAPGASPSAGDTPAVTLNPAQRAAAEAICAVTGFAVKLLYGVTGSGKTEVYLQAIERTLAADPCAQALLLVPEINLTPQLEALVAARFAAAGVVSLHSGLAAGERARAWLAAHEGRARILVGTRMAVFASLPALRLIVVDEEHDPSYKSGEGLRYSARDLAIKRAQILGVPVVLGSATPAIESWAHAARGSYGRLDLPSRAADDARLPALELVDLRVHKPEQGLAAPVRAALERTLERGEQSLVFLNRRGYAPVIGCGACGWLSNCPRCSAYAVFHKTDGQLACHHCGWSQRVPRACPQCGNLDLQAVGQGTQRVEEALQVALPAARVLRIDRDSTRRPSAARSAFEAVHAGEVDVLVGTQMIAKGHDFRRVSLVAILNADAQLVSHDFRAPERLFSSLLQVAGRAGRGGLPGRVLVQTRFPGHPLFAALASQDYTRFADAELAARREAGMPPWSHQALLTAQAGQLEDALAFLRAAAEAGVALSEPRVRLYDPVPMSVMRVAGVERAQLLVESDLRGVLQAFLRAWLEALRAQRGRVRWNLEVDPQEV